MQVEYYLSDENLQTDKFLMNYLTKDKDGFGKSLFLNANEIAFLLWLTSFLVFKMCKADILLLAVPVGVIASFRKLKKLTQDRSLIVAALRESSVLVSHIYYSISFICIYIPT